MFPILDVDGDGAYERGRQYGLKARARIEHSLDSYAKLFAACDLEWQHAQYRSRPYSDAINDFDARLYEEVCGIAAGAGCETDAILALNTRTEILPRTFALTAVSGALGGRLAPRVDFAECSALAIHPGVSETGNALLAQNWDWIGSQKEALILLRGTFEDGTSYLTLTEAGMLAKIGFNAHGFGICLNVLRSQDDGIARGLPIHILLRALLECDSVEAAIARVSGVRFSASSNVLCADVSGASAALELSPSGTHVLRGQRSVVCHTNHFLAADALRPMPPSPSSVPRLDRMLSLAKSIDGLFSVATVQRILRDESDGFRSISLHPNPSIPSFARLETVASVIMDLGGQVMHVAAGIPTRTEYRAVPLREARALG